MHPVKPRRALMSKWRLMLAVVMAPMAFLAALVFPPGEFLWTLLSCGWVLLFLLFYLVYFPIRYHFLSYRITGDAIVYHNGVFFSRNRMLYLRNVQFTDERSSLLDRPWGLTTVVVTAPGGRMRIPGLSAKDATALVDLLSPSGTP